MSGHGYVVPNLDGSRARCGGPAICADCGREYAQAFPKAHQLGVVWPAATPGAPKASAVRVPLFTRLALALAEAADRQDIGDGTRCWCQGCWCLPPPDERREENCHRFNALLKEAGL